MAALVLAGCSGGPQEGGTEGGDLGVSSDGVPIMEGQWPFNSGERCEDESAPACDLDEDPGTREWSGLAAVGSVFTSDVDVTVAYRGGAVHRESTDDAANAESVHVVAFFDVTFPDSSPADEDLLSFDPDVDMNFQITSTGSADVEVWPGEAFRPEPGQTLTLAVSVASAGPRSLLGEEDPMVFVTSNYTYNLGPDLRTSGLALFAALDQDPDPDVLDDAVDSIELLGGNLAEFERHFARWLGGAPLVSVDAVDEGGPSDGVDPEPPSDTELPPPPTREAEDEVGDGELAPVDGVATFSMGVNDGYPSGVEAGRDDALNGLASNPVFADRSGEYYAHPDSDDYKEGFDASFAQGYVEGYEEVVDAQGGTQGSEESGTLGEAEDECSESDSLMECYG